MTQGRILVTGATGRHGGVGGFAARQLKARGAPVRALVHSRDHRAEALERLGIETAVGDLQNIASLRAAMADVDRVLFCYPIKDGFFGAAAATSLVARETGVRAFAEISLLPARADSPSVEAREHWLASQMFDWARVNPIHILGGFFYQNLSVLAGEDFVTRGEMLMPFGDGENPLAWVSAEDVARFAVAALLNPEPYVNKTHYVTGPELLSLQQMAGQISEVLGREIGYSADISMKDWIARVASHPIATPRMLQHVGVLAVGIGQTKASFGRATDAVLKATGQQPETFRSFFQANSQEFVTNAEPEKALEAGAAAG
jgi:NAD(P)H dehydrogenase (quinone)